MSNPVLKLGSVDSGARPGNVRDFFKRYHEAAMLSQDKFRGEVDHEWIAFTNVSGGAVKAFQTTMRDFGFYPKGPIDGIFGYRTLGAARLFQEYVRSIEGHTEIGVPDGAVGPKTYTHIDRWKAANHKADWVKYSPTAPSDEFKLWLGLLDKIKAQGATNKALELLNSYSGATDTRKIAEWDFSADKTHLIGIRRKEWLSTGVRQNDDVFVLLVNGFAFKFMGSTDPNQKMGSRPDEPFIIKGQHVYRFGWHKMSDAKRVYRAWKPAGSGVLVFRDVDNDNALTAKDIQRGLQPNLSINIHWSGIGTTNWSAGCQVISGKSYMNHHGQDVDCSAFASRGYSGLGGQTRGAYNVLLDLVTIYADVFATTGDKLYYTLIYEDDLDLEPKIGALKAMEMLQTMRE